MRGRCRRQKPSQKRGTRREKSGQDAPGSTSGSLAEDADGGDAWRGETTPEPLPGPVAVQFRLSVEFVAGLKERNALQVSDGTPGRNTPEPKCH